MPRETVKLKLRDVTIHSSCTLPTGLILSLHPDMECETPLQSNAVSHWLGANLKSPLAPFSTLQTCPEMEISPFLTIFLLLTGEAAILMVQSVMKISSKLQYLPLSVYCVCTEPKSKQCWNQRYDINSVQYHWLELTRKKTEIIHTWKQGGTDV